MVYALCRLLLRDGREAEDATQQTFLQALRSMLGGVRPENPAGWLATIARHECGRRASRRPPDGVPLSGTEEGGVDPFGLVDQRAEIEALCTALAELPRVQREAFVLREFYGLSYREVAVALGLSKPAVESVLFKSRRRLQRELGPIRVSAGVFALPPGLADSFAAAVPGFSTAAAGGALANVSWLPAASKLAAVLVAIGSGTAITADATHHVDLVPGPPLARAAQARGVEKPKLLLAPQFVGSASRLSVRQAPASRPVTREGGEGEAGEEAEPAAELTPATSSEETSDGGDDVAPSGSSSPEVETMATPTSTEATAEIGSSGDGELESSSDEGGGSFTSEGSSSSDGATSSDD